MSISTDRQWLDAFVVELRLRGVPGDVIGDAVATVRELLRDSGQSAAEQFGNPRDYAASLDLGTRPGVPWASRSASPGCSPSAPRSISAPCCC